MKTIRKNAPAGAEYVKFVQSGGNISLLFSRCDEQDNAMEFIDGEWLLIPGRDLSYLEASSDWHPLTGDIPNWLWLVYGAAMTWAFFVIAGL